MKQTFFIYIILFFSVVCVCSFAQDNSPEVEKGKQAESSVIVVKPFGAGGKVSSRKPLKPAKVTVHKVDCFGPAVAERWLVEYPAEGEGNPVFSIALEDDTPILKVAAGKLIPRRTTVRAHLPGDGVNGNGWSKTRADYVSFFCKSNSLANMTFHLLQRGKTPGSYQAGFTAKPGEWQKVVIPLENFGLRSFSKVAGFGIRSSQASADTEVSIKDIRVGNMHYTENSWRNHIYKTSVNGQWRFSTDPENSGGGQKWYEDKFDDSAWKILESGKSWQQQGVDYYGWGWYRQNLFVPKELSGIPLSITLCQIPSDDDFWFNGKRVGGLSSEYKYTNWITRTYVVPPEMVRYGENNSIALCIWGGNITFIRDKSGLIKGPLSAEFDPYSIRMRAPGGKGVHAELFDLSQAQRGKPFEIIASFPEDFAKQQGVKLKYSFSDFLGNEIIGGTAPLSSSKSGASEVVIPVDKNASHEIYLRGRIKATMLLEDNEGTPLFCGTRSLERLNFFERDNKVLPPLPATLEDTPYGKLKLIDEIDCSVASINEEHPYVQSGYEHIQDKVTPGSPVEVKITEFAGKKARETGYGWFGYRIGRGKLKPHSTYLLRIEYPEDKPRFAPVEIQTGQNYMDVGWKNGVGKNDVYDNWPLSGKWEWYDVVFPLDDETVGTGGTGSSKAENGVWVYFMNKQKPGIYYSMWSGGPAVARMKLYEIDPEKNAPVIRKPEGLPQRTLALDWERQPDHDPEDLIKYAKLMGYNAISPVMIKWFFANYSDPLNGYESMVIDPQNYWAHKAYDPESGKDAESPYPQLKSQHVRYIEASKKLGINYIPRFEWGGSQDLPADARAIDANGKQAKPNRFAPWCTDLLDERAWEDLKKLMDHLIKPYVADNPQLTGAHWRIRCNRLPISYSQKDIELFSKETGTPLPGGSHMQWVAWATGAMKDKYDAWWHQKRADFHIRLSKLLQSYRPDLKLYYFNWDADKFGIIEPDITAWGFVKKVVKPGPEGGRAAYEKEREVRSKFTAKDYIYVMHSGNFGAAFYGINRADMGIRPELYKDAKGIEIFCPSNYLCYADKPDYLNYFQTADGLAVSNVVSYDELGSRSINPKYEGNMITPAGAPFSMALELLAYFHGDVRTLNYTVYTYGRGFADAHRRFAQAFLALPAIKGEAVDQNDPDLKVRRYTTENGTYYGVAYKGYSAKKLVMKLPGAAGKSITDLVTGKTIAAQTEGDDLVISVDSGPMELNAYLVK